MGGYARKTAAPFGQEGRQRPPSDVWHDLGRQMLFGSFLEDICFSTDGQPLSTCTFVSSRAPHERDHRPDITPPCKDGVLLFHLCVSHPNTPCHLSQACHRNELMRVRCTIRSKAPRSRVVTNARGGRCEGSRERPVAPNTQRHIVSRS